MSIRISIGDKHLKIMVSLLFSVALPLQFAYAEVSVQQSTTSDVNGQKISVQSENDKTVIKTGDKTLTITGDTLQYCTQACHEYRLYANGTISEKT
jgi:hypothetical protein